MNRGKDFEKFIELLYAKLDVDSKIKRDDSIYGHDTKTKRQIDLSIRRKIGAHEILMIVQARDKKRKLDVNAVGEFQSVIADVRANKGILISSRGFTAPALRLAKTVGIEALTAHDFSHPRWTLDVKMPVILSDYSGVYNANFIFVATQQYADLANGGTKFSMPASVFQMEFTEDNGKTFKTARQIFYELCQADWLKYDGKEGKAKFLAQLELKVASGVLVPAKDFTFTYKLNRKVYYKYLDIKHFEGLINHLENKIQPTSFRVEGSDIAVDNYNVEFITELALDTWNEHDEGIKLVHPYKVSLVRLQIGEPKQTIKWELIKDKQEK